VLLGAVALGNSQTVSCTCEATRNTTYSQCILHVLWKNLSPDHAYWVGVYHKTSTISSPLCTSTLFGGSVNFRPTHVDDSLEIKPAVFGLVASGAYKCIIWDGVHLNDTTQNCVRQIAMDNFSFSSESSVHPKKPKLPPRGNPEPQTNRGRTAMTAVIVPIVVVTVIALFGVAFMIAVARRRAQRAEQLGYSPPDDDPGEELGVMNASVQVTAASPSLSPMAYVSQPSGGDPSATVSGVPMPQQYVLSNPYNSSNASPFAYATVTPNASSTPGVVQLARNSNSGTTIIN